MAREPLRPISDPRQNRRRIAIAQRHVQQQQMEAAERICREILADGEPEPYALTLLAARAMKRGEPERAAELRRQLCEVVPGDPRSWHLLAMAEARCGRPGAAAEAYRRAVSLAPGNAPLLASAALAINSAGHRGAAARCMARAFDLDASLREAHSNSTASPALRDLSVKGHELLGNFHHEADRAVSRDLEASRGEPLPERWWRFLGRFHRRAPVEFADARQQPNYLYYEGLTARPFWPRARFGWLRELESRTDAIRKEFVAAMDDRGGFEPYLKDDPKVPEEWRGLSGQMNWASMHLVRGNRPVEENCRRCPLTAEAIADLPLVEIDGHAPEVFFSVLQPGTHIPPHYGVSNAKLAIHLPVIIPEDCAIKVGGQVESWEEGTCLVFDDSFLHEAWNRSDRTRVVLILETWHPDLSELERRCLRAIIERADRWQEENRFFSVDELELPALEGE